ncbi:MAG: GTP-binding protein, partial [Oscillospiraceae bacterium]|nr:GTP-binding protein [Oscillospiraceae bacterium]
MTVIDIFSGFLGAGKTTLIKKLIAEAFRGQKLVLIENEFGEIGIDGAFLREAGGQAADLEITEMNSGCICCSLVGDFASALDLALDRFHPDRVLIEPSGVGKLSDVAAAVAGLKRADVRPGACITVADALRCRMYAKNFGEFYTDQIASADLVVLSRTQGLSEEKLETAIHILREIKPELSLVTTPWDALSGEQIYAAASAGGHWAEALMEEAHHHHHEEEDDGDDDHEGDEHDHDHDHE